jgi:hypothetical protein
VSRNRLRAPETDSVQVSLERDGGTVAIELHVSGFAVPYRPLRGTVRQLAAMIKLGLGDMDT